MAERPNDMYKSLGNKTLICRDSGAISNSIWYSYHPLESGTNLLLLQLSLVIMSSHLVDFVLKPLGQSIIVSQIFAGILFGPSILGHSHAVANALFPGRGITVFETAASLGLMFFVFSLGVKTNLAVIIQQGRKAIALGLSVFIVTMGLTIALSFILLHFVDMSSSLAKSLPFIAASEAISSFPVITCLLTELKLLNTELGRLALAASMLCDVIGTAMIVIVLPISQNDGGSIVTILGSILSTPLLVLALVYLVRPAILWISHRAAEQMRVDEKYIILVFLLVVLSGLTSELIGQHYAFGPVVLGVLVPDGPPLGAALASKLDMFISGVMYPTYIAVSGLRTNVFELTFKSLWIISCILLFSIIVKIAAAMIPALYYKYPVREAFVLGLIMNGKGVLELFLYNIWKENQLLTDEEHALCVIGVLITTAIVAPLIRHLYDPLGQQISIKRSTIQHVKRNEELRILVSIHDYDNIPTVINLLEISHATPESPIAVIAVHMVELIGRNAPVLLSHQNENRRTLQATSSQAGQLENAFRHYAQHNEGSSTVHSYTDMSHREMMHEDICQLAMSKKANIIILPFHKQWAIDGSIGFVDQAMRTMNKNILERAPCSVGILVDKAILNGSMSVLANRATYHVAVLFLGGQDDAEALAYGSRMAKHERVDLTVIRFLLFGNENSKERKRDTNLIDEYRHANVGNPGFVYVEEVVKDSSQLATFIKGIVDSVDLVMVGRHHHISPLLMGFDEWSECEELGVIGDMLASPDFVYRASVLVVQQQRLAGKNEPRQIHNADGSWAIQMDRS